LDEPAEINFAKMEELRKKLDTYCAQNPTHGIMAALDIEAMPTAPTH
jgi:hypothetical protein